MFKYVLVQIVILTMILPSHMNSQNESTSSWQQVISTTPANLGDNDTPNIGKKRPLLKKDHSMTKIFKGLISRPEILSFKVCINKMGTVTFVEVKEKKTSIKNADILRQALGALQKYTFQADQSAQPEECGAFEIIVK